jgi:hypothetical protein
MEISNDPYDWQSKDEAALNIGLNKKQRVTLAYPLDKEDRQVILNNVPT